MDWKNVSSEGKGNCVRIPNFESVRFVWLIEAVGQHLQLDQSTFLDICKSVLSDLCEHPTILNPLKYLQDICVISKSPSLQLIPMLRETVNRVFARVLRTQYDFLHRYIFGGYVHGRWDGEMAIGLSDAVAAWTLYLKTIRERTVEIPNLPQLIVTSLINDSLAFFQIYYGGIQPSRERATDLRRDIFVILTVSEEAFPGKFSGDTIRKAWFLLAIAAVSGASDDDLREVKPIQGMSEKVFLGLEHSDTEFVDYKLALGQVMAQFTDEVNSFPAVFASVRQNFESHT
jgi:hypothetical protein